MKKTVAMLLCLVLLLGLAACNSEEREMMEMKAERYDKYANIIEALEEKQFNQALYEVSHLYWEDVQANAEPRPPIEERMYGTWYAYSVEDDAPVAVTLNADGTGAVDGTAMTWVPQGDESSGEWVHCYLLADGEYRYGVTFHSDSEASEDCDLELYTCRMEEWGPSTDEWLGSYRDNPHLRTVRVGWNRMVGGESFPGWLSFTIDEGYQMYYNDMLFDMEISSDAAAQTLDFSLTGVEGTEAVYSAVMEQKDGHYVLNITDTATGDTAFYYNDEYGYEESWEEYRYSELMNCVERYVESGYYFYWNDTSYENNEARKQLYTMMTELSGFRDVDDYLARFMILPDVLTKYERVTVDMLDREDRRNWFGMEYNTDGSIYSVWDDQYEYTFEHYGMYTDYRVYPVYDASGKLTKVTVGTGDNISGVGTPTFDDNGNLATMHTQWGTSEDLTTFTYDDQGRVVEITFEDGEWVSDCAVYTYTYNDDGTLAQRVRSRDEGYYITTVDYIYENGVLTERVSSYKTRHMDAPEITRYVYTNDTQGRPVSAEITRDPAGDYVSEKFEYTYNDVYFFDIADLAETEE